jgi:predicted O-linked N-acetylglucosamine transferase (SPINDLY family)
LPEWWSICGSIRRSISRSTHFPTTARRPTELAAADRAAYVRIAGDLARDTDKLNRLRLELRERMRTSTLMDAPRFAKSFEAALRTIWRAWCAEQGRPGC